MSKQQSDSNRVQNLIEPHATSQGGLLPALHALQKEYGFIDPSFHLQLADAFNLSLAEIKGVVSFYHDFHHEPKGRHVLRLCQAEACQSVGAVQLTDFAKELTGLDLGETSADQSLTLESVYCLGLCAIGPAAELDGAPVARMSQEKLSDFVSSAEVETV